KLSIAGAAYPAERLRFPTSLRSDFRLTSRPARRPSTARAELFNIPATTCGVRVNHYPRRRLPGAWISESQVITSTQVFAGQSGVRRRRFSPNEMKKIRFTPL